MSDASRVQLIYRTAAETVFGEAPPVLPPTGVPTTRIRLKSDSFKHENITVISDEIRADRQRTELALVGSQVAGDINFELTYGNFFEPAMEAALCGTWGTPTANTLRNGTTNRSFTFEKGWLDLGKYAQYRGCCVNTFQVTATARQIVQCVAGMMGSKGITAVSTSANSMAGSTSITQPNGNVPMRAGSFITITNAGGTVTELAGVSAREVMFNINNNLRPRELVTQEATDDFGRGVMEITGTVTTYFKDIVIYNAFLTNAAFGLRLTLKDPVLTTANTYQITFPSLRLTGADIPTPGVEQDIMQPLPFRALLDPGLGYAIDVVRAITS